MKASDQQAKAEKPATGAPPQSLIEKIQAQVAAMDRGALESAVAKIKQQREKQKQYIQRALTPEQKEKQKARAKEYMNRPEVKAKMKAYIQRPEVRERMKAQAKAKREQQKLILAKAKELGLTV